MTCQQHKNFNFFNEACLSNLLINPLDGRNTKKLKTKTADYFVNTGILVKLFQKKPTSFFVKNSQITILFWVLVFSFMYLVLVYPMKRTLDS